MYDCAEQVAEAAVVDLENAAVVACNEKKNYQV